MINRFNVEDKVVLVTGAARGNGKAIAEGFIDCVAVVYLLDILEEVNQTVDKLNNKNAHAIVCDLGDISKVEYHVAQIFDKENQIHVLVNNAAVIQYWDEGGPYAKDSWDKNLKINLFGALDLTRIVLKLMEQQQEGVIINITSPTAERAFSRCPAYSVSKAGLRQLTKVIAKDYAHCNIRANNICPGYMKTAATEKSYGDTKLRKERLDRIMMDRWGEPNDLAGPCIFLASPAAAYVTGCDLYVDGGFIANGL